MHEYTSDVAIVGGGPFGLMLANELGRRGVSAVLFDKKDTTAFNPQANATQARTMEHYRRLGFADEVRVLGLPEDFPTDIAYFTRFARHELGRFSLPSAREAREMVTAGTGSWSAAELPHRVSQKYVEQVLRAKADELPEISINFGWRVLDFEDTSEGVLVEAEERSTGRLKRIHTKFLAAGDGARSFVRARLGFEYVGDQTAERDFFGGRMFAVYLRCPQFYDIVPFARAWMNVTFNQDRRAFMATVDGRGEFAFHTQLRPGEDEAAIGDAEALELFRAAVGHPVEAEILSRGTWMAGYALVADGFSKGRVFLGGDAVHLFTPAGGLGYNTAVDDAVNLGWKLAHAIRGNAGPKLLASYEAERRPAAVRNTQYARGFAKSLGDYLAKPGLEEDTPEGANLRKEAGAYLADHGRREFNIPGITFGVRYDDSPVICSEGRPRSNDSANTYVPDASPGGRAPHLWLEPTRSLYDLFGFEWSLLRLGDAPTGAFEAAARENGMELSIIDLPNRELRRLYDAALVLVRPDQVVAWRGASHNRAREIVNHVLGFAP